MLTVANSDTYFFINGKAMKIGPLETQSSSDSSGSSFEHTAVEWSEDMSTLMIKEVSVLKEHSAYPYNTPSRIHTYISQTSISLHNGQLVIKGHDLGLENIKQREGSEGYSCTFSKEQE